MKHILLTISLILGATAVSAEEIFLVCETTAESTIFLDKNGNVTSFDDTIVTTKPSFTIKKNTISADHLILDGFVCNEPGLKYSDDKISAFCFGTYNSSGEYPTMAKSVEISRYTGKIEASITNQSSDGGMFMYSYEGVCEKSKKRF